MDSLTLDVLGCGLRVRFKDPRTRDLLHAAYGALRADVRAPAVTYTAGARPCSAAFFLGREGEEPALAADDAELLFQFETDLSIQLQRLRPDLYFLHGAALEHGGRAALLVAASGSGKSTTAWALVNHGLGYLSDELAPVDPRTTEVHPYPRALCLKARPPRPYRLPASTLVTSRTFHVPAAAMPGGVVTRPLPVAAVFFVEYRPGGGPDAAGVSRAEATARLLANALNPLAHPGSGLDTAMAIAAAVPAFRLWTGDLARTAELVTATLRHLDRASRTPASAPVAAATR